MEGMKNWIGTVVSGLKRSATCTVRGAISFNSCTHLPPAAGSLTRKPVMLPPGCPGFAAKPLPIGSDTPANTIGIVLVSRACADHGRCHTQDCVGPQIDQLLCQSPHPVRITGGPAKFDPEIAAFSPSQLGQRVSER